MSLFNGRKGIEQTKAALKAHKAAKEVQHLSTSPFGQRLIAENRALRSQAKRLNKSVDELTSERDDLQDARDQHAAEYPDCGTLNEDDYFECPGCGNTLEQNLANFPGLLMSHRHQARARGIDWRLCTKCTRDAIPE